MTYLVYDTSFEGFLTAVFEVYELKLERVAIRKNNVEIPQLFGETIPVITNKDKAKRVADKIIAILGKQGFQSLLKSLLSEMDTIEDSILDVIRYAIKTNENVLNDFGHPAVLEIQQILKKLSRERHRMNAFVRFKLANDGLYYAFIEPDFDVLPLISNHFKSRYADQKWLIYDLKRNKGIFYNLQKVEMVQLEDSIKESEKRLNINLDTSEIEFQKLWKSYFKSTNILSRKNMKLHLQHVPKRYWKYLIEKK
ncbi:TIGR03915 family putative DNA repair protein [Aureibaculum sp. 2210JD6-5]|uniref:TIGR03915 family putative DNA repair protein n=1 Tax=Aureibaculum sp. 2210JD6-5 TaxID=3103957 RepID=UPI002AADE7E0|nr:TIGR03915 family putative DNA repair protein [Aureibaculum sp. 2210JD6-5]MDY7394999.1 TIGR03915 family putative DNA repair protein [Aureibaculum sp. 2210JD6-5]